jgi:hypothetical protein
MSEQEGFLSRWSRRKRAAVDAPPAPAEAAPPLAAPSTGYPVAGSPAAEALPEFDPASLPPIESLTAESDITGFLRPQVPAALRTAALRRVWTLDPAIRDYVGPADYAWDYNAPDGMAGFSLELGGDVKRLLAQAIGLVEEDEEKAPVGTVVAELPEAAPPPLSAPVAAPAAELERGPDPAAQPDSPIGSSLDSPLAAPPRRHGGARPV